MATTKKLLVSLPNDLSQAARETNSWKMTEWKPAYKNVFPEIYSEVVVFVPDDPSYSPRGKVRKGLFSTHPLYEAGETQENKIVNIGIQGRGTKCPLTNW